MERGVPKNETVPVPTRICEWGFSEHVSIYKSQLQSLSPLSMS
uniref:Uncharacterized protein n=1 Tax=Anguilla anguilla TaxID=7936 RepID=A0A0E9VAV6_ANGAN